MSTLLITTYKNQVEQALMKVLRLAMLHRRATVADLAALAAIDVSAYADGDLVNVTAESRVYEYSRFSGAAASAPTVIAPTTIPAAFPGARWLRASSAATYGPNWRAPLHARTTGTLRALELYAGEGTAEEKFARLLAATPSAMLEFRSDEPRPQSCGYQGSNYRIDMQYVVTFFSDNNRASPASSWGSPASLGETADPGPAALIGEMRKVCAGLSGVDLELQGVDRVEIGASRLVQEDLAERFLVWEAELRLICYVEIPDEDLEGHAIDLAPMLTETPPDGSDFDPMNYVASGYTVPAGAGLAATPAPGIAVVGGVAVSSAPPAHTFTAARDTYRDLADDGSLLYLEAYPGHPAPSVTAGALRVGVTRTDAADVISDRILCSYSQVFRAPYQILP